MRFRNKQLPSLRGKIVALSLGTTVGVLALCIFILLLLVTNVLSAYIENDLDFALKETGNNLAVKTDLLADTLLEIRRNPMLMSALSGKGLERNIKGKSVTEDVLKRVVDIYSDKNTDKLDAPFVDMVYLFDNKGVYNKSTYVERLQNLQTAIDLQYETLYKEFCSLARDVAVLKKDAHINVIYTVYDQTLRPCGTVIFALNQSAIRQLMSKALEYKDSFWLVFDINNRVILNSEPLPLSNRDVLNLIAQGFGGDTFIYQVAGTGYRVYGESENMGIGTLLGVSSNQLSLLLFDSVKNYLYGMVVALVLVGITIFLITMYLTQPLKEVASKLKLVAEEQFDTKLPQYKSREFNTISHTFNTMTDTINHLINDVYEKKLMVMDVEMKFLQSQMKPHFMYNVLNTIALKAQMDGNEEVCRMASNFSGLTQARLNHNGDEKVTLEQELKYVRFYLELQKSRFEEKLNYFIQIDDERLLKYFIPKLTVELIAENAVLHGIEPKTEPGTVYIEVFGTPEGIKILIEDDGVGFNGQDGTVKLPIPEEEKPIGTKHNHIALNNAWKIIRHFYGGEYGIFIESRKDIGSIVTVFIPYDEEEC